MQGPSVPALMEGNLVDVLSTILDSERITVEVKCNALSLIGFLTQSGEDLSFPVHNTIKWKCV